MERLVAAEPAEVLLPYSGATWNGDGWRWWRGEEWLGPPRWSRVDSFHESALSKGDVARAGRWIGQLQRLRAAAVARVVGEDLVARKEESAAGAAGADSGVVGGVVALVGPYDVHCGAF